jgi:mannose-1-phosphate guanylyltransferase
MQDVLTARRPPRVSAGALGRERWAVILAGGDGVRLRPLTRAINGDDRPKQFCPVIGSETLLAQTRRRAALLVPGERTVAVVTALHERYYADALAGAGAQGVVAQPENRGTTPAILYALLRVAAEAPGAAMAMLPSDHYVSDDALFMAHVDAAFDATEARPDALVLLGITPDTPETEYGWIEPGEVLLRWAPLGLHRVRRFWEKPAAPVAERLRAAGCFWNSFVMVARVAKLLSLVQRAMPDLDAAFAPLRSLIGTPGERDAARALYARLPASDFSRQVLVARPGDLAVLPVRGVTWSDLGHPDRVLAVRSAAARGSRVPLRASAGA